MWTWTSPVLHSFTAFIVQNTLSMTRRCRRISAQRYNKQKTNSSRQNSQTQLSPFQVHKRRLKALELEPYSIEESERAAGAGSYRQAKKRALETQPTKEELVSGAKKVKCEIVVEEEEEDAVDGNKMD